MHTGKKVSGDLYYTHDHEWIDFQGSVAYVGVCAFKLKGIRQVDLIQLAANDGCKEQGDVILTVRYDDYEIPVCMPVRGKVISINEALLGDGRELLLEQPEGNGWVALIVPEPLQQRTGLMLPEQYTLIVTQKN